MMTTNDKSNCCCCSVAAAAAAAAEDDDDETVKMKDAWSVIDHCDCFFCTNHAEALE